MSADGVIPDPEIQKFTLTPAVGDGDGDLIVIVASDGVWEFIETQVWQRSAFTPSKCNGAFTLCRHSFTTHSYPYMSRRPHICITHIPTHLEWCESMICIPPPPIPSQHHDVNPTTSYTIPTP